MHPSEEIFCEKGTRLKGKKIVLGITGSIAAVDTFHLIRELIRNGADITPVMSEAAVQLVAPDAIEFATGKKPILSITGQTEHIKYFAEGSDTDLYLIHPITANTISKIANGIDDTPVTTMATVVMGSDIPLMVVPAMHGRMFSNPAVAKNLQSLRDMGVYVVGPHMEENRAKAASTTEVAENVYRVLSEQRLKGRKVLIIGGRSSEPIDSMRVITNRSSGRTAVSLAKAAFREGADVELWMGGCDVSLPGYIPTKRYGSVSDLLDMVDSIDHDLVVVPAALADFTPENVSEGKISSDSELNLKLVPVEKVLPRISAKCPLTVGYKAESGLDREALIAKAKERIVRYGLSAIIADDISVAGKTSTEAMFITPDRIVDMDGTKDEVAETIIGLISE